MKCLTLLQPWATLVWIAGHSVPSVRALGKGIETRSWWTAYRGPLAIHASKKWDKATAEWVLRSWAAEPIRFALREAGFGRLAELPLGCVIVTANLVDCAKITAANAPPEPERSYGDYTPGRYARHLDNIDRLPAAIPYRGAQGLWEAPIEEQLRAQGVAV